MVVDDVASDIFASSKGFSSFVVKRHHFLVFWYSLRCSFFEHQYCQLERIGHIYEAEHMARIEGPVGSS